MAGVSSSPQPRVEPAERRRTLKPVYGFSAEKDEFFQRVLEDARAQARDRDVGHRGHFLGDYLLGSTADPVAHHAHRPVIVVR
jgi:hypothetical protein